MSLTYFGATAIPPDNDATGLDDSIVRPITPVPSIPLGSLVRVFVAQRTVAPVIGIVSTGGQTWSSRPQQGTGSRSGKVFWCQFNGTWSSNPSWENNVKSGSGFSIEMIVFRPSSSSNLITEELYDDTNHAAPAGPPYNVTATSPGTPTLPNSVAIHSVVSGDDNSYGVVTAGWTAPGGVTQRRNLTGNDLSLATIYKTQTTIANPALVTTEQTANGPDAATTFYQIFIEQSTAPPAATIDHVQSVSQPANSANPHVLSFASDVTAGSAIVVKFRTSVASDLVTGVTDNRGNTYSAVVVGGFSDGFRRIYCYYALNCAAGATTVSVQSSSSQVFRWGIYEYSGVAPVNALDDEAHAAFTATTAPASSNLTTTTDGCMLIGMMITDNATTSIAAAGGAIEREEEDLVYQVEDKLVAAAGNYTLQWTLGNAQAGAYFVIALKPGVAGGGGAFISSVDSDNQLTAAQQNATIDGSGFEVDGALAKIELVDGAVTSLCTKVSWTDTHIVFHVVLGNCRYGSRVIKVTTHTGNVDTQPVTIIVQSGATQVTDVGTLRALTWDASNKPSRLTPKGSAADGTADLTGADQIEMTRTVGSGAYQVDTDGRLQWVIAMQHGQWRWHGAGVWSAFIEWDLRGLPRVFAGPNIADATYSEDVLIAPLNHSQRYTDPNTTAIGGTYAIQGGPVSGLLWNSVNGQETGTPDTAGTTSGLKLRFTNTEGTYTESNAFARIIEAIPNAPFFTGTIGPNFTGAAEVTFLTIPCGLYFTFATSFALTGNPLPNGLTLNAVTGEILGTPLVGSGGTYTGIVVTGSGVGTPANSNAFTIEIIEEAQVSVPDVVGFLEADANSALTAVLLTARTAYVPGIASQAGKVTAQAPAAGVLVDVGSTVNLVVAKALIPNFFALTPAEANAKGAATGYSVGTITPENSQQLPGRIIRQDPTAGLSSDTRAVIDVWIGQEMNLGARTKRRWE